jgi:phage tail sheath protein FI
MLLALLAILAWLVAQVLPGTTVDEIATAPPRSAPTDVGVWFATGLADRGPVNRPIVIRSLAEFVQKLGARVNYSVLYDCAETFFREGGGTLIIGRVVGPAAAKASRNLLDAAAAVSLTVNAKSEGTWGNNLTVAVAAGTNQGYKLTVKESGKVVETADNLLTQADAVTWSQNSNYVDIALGASADVPDVVGDTALQTGTDDRNNIVEANWTNALTLFSKDLGPGQVSAPGRTTAGAQQAICAHCEANNRTPYLDLVDSHDRATLVTAALAQRGQPGANRGGPFAPWAVIPGLTPGTFRTVPYSAVQAGITARNDGLGYSPNVPAAGDKGQSIFAVGLSQDPWNDADRGALNDAGVNVALIKYNGVRTYGFRTLADPINDPLHLNLSNARLDMAIQNDANIIAEAFEFSEIDGKKIQISKFQGQLVGMLLDYYAEGSLFGDTPAEAFNVDVGDQVNTPETLANDELHAVIAIRRSPMAERVIIHVAKVPVTEAIA